MVVTPFPPKLKIVGRATYKSSADFKCRARLRGSPRLLEKLLTRLGQAKQLYLLNIWSRGALVSKHHLAKSTRVHRGKKWRVVSPSKWHLGFTWGSLSRTRRVAAFKARAANKKRKKTSKGTQLISDMRILQFRALQSGQKRRTSTRASLGIEQQLRAILP